MTATKKRIGPAELGIDVGRGTDAPVFRWLIACNLFGDRISQEIAADAYRELDKLGVLTPAALAQADRRAVVNALGRGRYKRYDESTARELIGIGKRVQDEYGGHITRLKKDVDSRHALAERVQEFQGVGPTAAEIFVREVAPAWKL